MTQPPFDEQQGLRLNDQWWGAHIRGASGEETLCSIIHQPMGELYRTSGEDGWTFALFLAPEDEEAREALLFDQDTLIVQTCGTIYGPWLTPSGKPIVTTPPKAEPQSPAGSPRNEAPPVPPQEPRSALSSEQPPAARSEATERGADGDEQPNVPSAGAPARARRRAPRSLIKPPEGIDFAGLNVELDGDAAWIRLTFPDGEGPATRLHTRDTPLGRVIRETIANKTREPLKVVDDVGIARETQAAMTSRWEDGTMIPPVYTNRFFWKYDHESGVWVKISNEDMKRLVNEAWWRHPCFKPAKGEDASDEDGLSGKIYPLSLSVGKINAIVEMIALECERPTFFSDRSESRGGVAFQNGFATVENGEVVLLPKSPRNRAEFILPFDYDERMTCPRWMAFLDEAMEPGERHAMTPEQAAIEREAKKALLGEFAGVCLLGNATEHQKCLVMDGRGGNGKSVVTEILQNLFAGDSISNVAPHDWNKSFTLAVMVGKRMNVASELPERDMVEGHVFKAVIAGDAITVENKFEKPFTTKMTAGHIFAANELPHSRDLSDGFWRRFMVLSLDQRFDNRANVDTKLSHKIITEEIGGVAVWCLRHAAELEKRGGKFSAPITSAARKEEWKKQSNPLEMFLEEVVTYAPAKQVSTDNVPTISGSAFYEVYAEWAKKRGHGVLSETKFGSKIKPLIETLSSAAGAMHSWKKGKSGTVYYVGINPDWKWVVERNLRNRG